MAAVASLVLSQRFCDNLIQTGAQLGKAMIYRRFSFLAVVAMLAGGLGVSAHAQDQAPQNQSGTLVIHVRDVSPKGGIVRLGLYDEARYPDDDSKPVASADVQAQTGETVITLNNVPSGTYAIQTFQDINSNDKMDTSWFGFPLEPFGFSRDAQPRLSKPRFSAVKFDVTPGMNVQILHLQDSVSIIAQK